MVNEERRTLSIEARVRDFASRQFDKIGRSVRGFARSAIRDLKRFGAQVFSVRGLLTGVASVVGTGLGIATLTGTVAAQTTEVARWAEKLNTGTEELSALSFAVQQFGLDQELLFEGLKTVQERLDDASRGATNFRTQFRELGIEITDSNGALRNAVDILPELARAYRDASENGAERLVFTTEELIGGGEAMLDVFLRQGPEAIARFTAEARRLGVTIDEEAVMKAREWEREWNKLRAVIASVGRDLGLAFSPLLSDIANEITEFVAANREKIVDGVLAGAEKILEVARLIGQAFATTFSLIESAANALGVNPLQQQIHELRLEIEALEGQRGGLLATNLFTPGQDDRLMEIDQQLDTLRTRAAGLEQQLEVGLAAGISEGINTAFEKAKTVIEGTRVRVNVEPFVGPPAPGTEEELGFTARIAREQQPGSQGQAPSLSGGLGQEAVRNTNAVLMQVEETLLRMGVNTREVDLRLAELDLRAQSIQLGQVLQSAELDAQVLEQTLTEAGNVVAEVWDRTRRLIEGDFALSFGLTTEQIVRDFTDMTALGQLAARNLVGGGLDAIAQGFSNIALGVSSSKDAVREWGRFMLEQLSAVISRFLVAKAVGAAIGIFTGGVGAAGASTAGAAAAVPDLNALGAGFAPPPTAGVALPSTLQSQLDLVSGPAGSALSSLRLAERSESQRIGASAVSASPGGSQGAGPTFIFQVQAADSQDVSRWLSRQKSQIMAMFNDAVRNQPAQQARLRQAVAQ